MMNVTYELNGNTLLVVDTVLSLLDSYSSVDLWSVVMAAETDVEVFVRLIVDEVSGCNVELEVVAVLVGVPLSV